jgi:hypothetical protein
VNVNSELAPGFQAWTIMSANGINDNGQIVGLGQLGGQQFAVELTPIPEPGTIVLAAVALAAWVSLVIRSAVSRLRVGNHVRARYRA